MDIEQAPQKTAVTDEQIAKDDATDAKPDAAVAGDSGGTSNCNAVPG